MDRRIFLGAGLVGAALTGGDAQAQRPKPDSGPLDARGKIHGTATEALAAYAVGQRYDDLDAATLQKAKHRLLDLMGCAIGGAPGEGNAALAALLRQTGGTPEASVIGYPVKGPAGEVALTNAIIARSFDFEVMTVEVAGHEVQSHHAPTTVMTTLALCEQQHRSGKEFLTALTVGDDISARMLAAAGLDFGLGWDGVPLYATFGATAIAARLLGLSAEQTRFAFGMATDQIGGTIQSLWDGATNWKLQQGTPARSGIFCARLAKEGWSGMQDALLAPYGFYAQYTAGCDHPELLTADLGRAFYAEEYFKPWPSCAANHTAIDCAIDLKTANRLDAADITAVTVMVPAAFLRLFVAKPFATGPSAHAQANFSLPFAVSTALLYGTIRQEHYEPAALKSPDLARLIAGTAIKPLPAGATGARIAVTTRDGKILAQDHPGQASHYPKVKGSTYAEIVAKFRQQVAFSGFVVNADEIIRRVDALEQEKDMADFAAAMTRTVLGAA